MDGLICLANKNKNKKGGKRPAQQRRSRPRMVSRKPRNVSSMVPRGIRLHPCTAKLAYASADAFDQRAVGCCIPDMNTRPSMKVTSFAKFTCHIGTAGFGHVLIAPSIANDVPSLYYTGSAYTGNGSTPFTTGTGTVGLVNLNVTTLPFSQADVFSSATVTSRPIATGRIVSYGLRWRYIGTELNRGGLTTAYSEPNHRTVEGLNAGIINGFRESIVTTPDDKHSARTFTGVSAQTEELDYPRPTQGATASESYLITSYPFSTGAAANSGANNGAPIAVVAFQGEPGNTFYCEYIIHVEYIGSATEPMRTVNYADPVGLQMVKNASDNAWLSSFGSGLSYLQSFWASLSDEMKQMAQSVLVSAVRGNGGTVSGNRRLMNM